MYFKTGNVDALTNPKSNPNPNIKESKANQHNY
jgi:hypothetical protein